MKLIRRPNNHTVQKETTSHLTGIRRPNKILVRFVYQLRVCFEKYKLNLIISFRFYSNNKKKPPVNILCLIVLN
jgi:hypothetical protein